MQPGREGDAVDAGIERRFQPHLERFLGRGHRELLHAVDEDEPWAALAFHGAQHVHLLRFGQEPEVEFHRRLVQALDVIFVALEFFFGVGGVVAPVGDGGHHGVRDVPDAAEAGDLEGEVGVGDVDAHPSEHDGDQLGAVAAETETEFIDTAIGSGHHRTNDPLDFGQTALLYAF